MRKDRIILRNEEAVTTTEIVRRFRTTTSTSSTSTSTTSTTTSTTSTTTSTTTTSTTSTTTTTRRTTPRPSQMVKQTRKPRCNVQPFKIDCIRCCNARFGARRKRTLSKCQKTCLKLPNPTVKPTMAPLDEVDPETCARENDNFVLCRGCCKQFINDRAKNYGCLRKCNDLAPPVVTTPKPTTTYAPVVVMNPGDLQCGVPTRMGCQNHWATSMMDGRPLYDDEIRKFRVKDSVLYML